MAAHPALYLGLDASTQGLGAVLLAADDERAEVVWTHDLSYDEALPQFGTVRGVLPSTDPAVVLSPPQMWEDALHLMFAALVRSGLDLSNLRAISGSAQQHGSVYLRADGTFSRDVSPVWLDSSTQDECDAITEAVGGADRLARHTGSRAYARFTGPQIRKFFETEPAAYADTARIHLVSSFLASRLIGSHAPLEPGDASGMNLMDLATRNWWPDAMQATAVGLEGRLPAIVPSNTVVGTLADSWRARYGVPPARVIAWTGDNPSSLVGTGVVTEGQMVVSLGTSDTVCGVMREPPVHPHGAGHVFGAPTGDWMGITVFANGSLARERVRDEFGLNWSQFSNALAQTPPGNHGRLMFPWFVPEITPVVSAPRVHRVRLADDDVAGNVRAIVEGQMLAMARHSRWMGVTPTAIRATGGASVNRDLLQVMADVWGVLVATGPSSNAASLGAALRAWHADRVADDAPLAWTTIVEAAGLEPATIVRPRREAHATYAQLQQEAARDEAALLGG